LVWSGRDQSDVVEIIRLIRCRSWQVKSAIGTDEVTRHQLCTTGRTAQIIAERVILSGRVGQQCAVISLKSLHHGNSLFVLSRQHGEAVDSLGAGAGPGGMGLQFRAFLFLDPDRDPSLLQAAG
jgi:hypothetical protein